MKSFATSVCIFLILLGIIIANSFYVTRVCNTLTQLLSNLPEVARAEDEAQILFDYWSRHADLLGISVSDHTLDRMNEHLMEMKYAVRYRDTDTFEKNRETALYVCAKIAEQERFSFKNWI